MKIKLFIIILIFLCFFHSLYAEEKTGDYFENPSRPGNEWKWNLKSTFLVEKFRGISAPDNEFNTKSFTFLKLQNKYQINPDIKIEMRFNEEILSISGNIKDKSTVYQSHKNYFYRRFKFSKVQLERDNLILKGEIGLLNVDLQFIGINTVIGRQVISWRHNYFWSPSNWLGSIECGTMDNKNKLYCADGFCSVVENAAEKYFDPHNLNFDGEKSIDAVRISVISGVFDGLEFDAAMGEENTRYEHIGIIRDRVRLTGIDLDIFFGKLKKENRIGLGLNKNFKAFEVISDVSCFLPEENENPFVLASLGGVYNGPNTVKINMEFYYNGYGVKDIEKYAEKSQDLRVVSGEINNIARYYMGIRYRNEYRVSWKSEISFIYNFVDRSNLLGPQVIYSISDNSEFSAGALFAAGRQHENTQLLSEFGTYPDNYYVQYDLNF